MPPVPYVRVVPFPTGTNARSILVTAHSHLNYRVRNSGSQVFVGNRNHRAEPVPVLRRALTLTDEQGQQHVGLRALPPSEHLPKCAKEDPGRTMGQSSPAVPGKAHHRV